MHINLTISCDVNVQITYSIIPNVAFLTVFSLYLFLICKSVDVVLWPNMSKKQLTNNIFQYTFFSLEKTRRGLECALERYPHYNYKSSGIDIFTYSSMKFQLTFLLFAALLGK